MALELPIYNVGETANHRILARLLQGQLHSSRLSGQRHATSAIGTKQTTLISLLSVSE
jgi:hypothetical protein